MPASSAAHFRYTLRMLQQKNSLFYSFAYKSYIPMFFAVFFATFSLNNQQAPAL